jgi:hypothetical protein
MTNPQMKNLNSKGLSAKTVSARGYHRAIATDDQRKTRPRAVTCGAYARPARGIGAKPRSVAVAMRREEQRAVIPAGVLPVAHCSTRCPAPSSAPGRRKRKRVPGLAEAYTAYPVLAHAAAEGHHGVLASAGRLHGVDTCRRWRSAGLSPAHAPGAGRR